MKSDEMKAVIDRVFANLDHRAKVWRFTRRQRCAYPIVFRYRKRFGPGTTIRMAFQVLRGAHNGP